MQIEKEGKYIKITCTAREFVRLLQGEPALHESAATFLAEALGVHKDKPPKIDQTISTG